MKLGAFLNKQQKNSRQLADVKKFKSFLEHNYMKSISRYTSYNYTNIMNM